MSMIGNISEQQRRNPRESAEEFAAQFRRPDTRIGDFLPAMSPVVGEPMSTIERAAIESLQRVGEESTKLVEQERDIADLRRIAAEQQRQREMFQQVPEQTYDYQGGLASDQTGEAFNADGSLSDSRRTVLQSASSYRGTPYQLGGTTARGIDCSGLVMAVYNQLGYGISQHSAGWQGRNIPGVRTSINNLRPGDIVAWKDGSHIAIYAGNGEIIDASRSRGTSRRPLWTSTDNVYGIALRLPGE